MPAPKRRLTAFAVAMAVLIATPLAVMATDRFTDVPNDNVHHDDITWLADAGVTLGCNPPANSEYCPEDAVTRQQMASFLRRLAENQVVDAATAVEADNADTLDGVDSAGFVGAPSDLKVFAAAYISGTTIRDSVGPVVSASNPATGEYRIQFGEELFPGGDEFAFINVTAVNIFGATCAWSFNGPSTDEIDISCRSADGLDANSSFTFVVYQPSGVTPAATGDAGADSGR